MKQNSNVLDVVVLQPSFAETERHISIDTIGQED